MEYPFELLPQPGFCVPFPFDCLKKKYGGYAVCYRIEGTVDENCEAGGFNGHKVLKESCFEHVVHLSMNLLGGAFKPEHVCFVQKKPGSNDWTKSEVINIEDYMDCIEKCEKATPIFYRNSVICQSYISIAIVFPDASAYKSFCQYYKKEKPLPPYKKGDSVDVIFETRIEHRPTNLNYWHVQMEVYPELKGEMLNNNNGVWRSRVFEHIRNVIFCHKFEEALPFQYDIPTELYRH